ncbi:MAG: class I adenylate-forming enzyme family protein [Candidatus Latescibacteria bacterium]|jgi:long-chain acyl-CoA synthetase|nr:class I adenylate-forming enzyme family protein [Candidatus Latescibacterota bacterium]
MINSKIFTCTKNNKQHTYQFSWRNFTHLLTDRAKNQPDKPALIFHDCDTDARTVITYAKFERRTAALAGHLHRDFGIQPGDCVSLALPNCAEIPLLTLALFRLGATSVPLDLAKDVPERKRYKIENAKSNLLVVLPEHAEAERQELPDIQIATTEQLLAADAPDADLEPQWSGDPSLEQHPNIVLYTSGTTGHPKGTLITRQSLTSNADGIIRWLEFDENERLNLVLPLHHINSTTFSVTSLMVGGTLILNSRYSVSAFWRVVSQERATSSSIVPTIMADLLSRANEFERADHDISSLKKIMIGSAPVPANIACQFVDRFGVRLVQGYGSTEVSLRVTGVPPSLPDGQYRDILEKNAIGVELDNNNVCIDGDPEEGDIGEILIRGPVVADGYLNQSEATNEVFCNGWFHTGDIGYYRNIHGHRFYFIHGRKKEIIIKGGVNISPIAVENALLDACPELDAVYVIGLRHDRWGEDVCAAAIFKTTVDDPEQTAQQIVEHGQNGKISGLSTYEAPSRIFPITHEDRPLTSTGKVQRSALRNTIQKQIDNT